MGVVKIMRMSNFGSSFPNRSGIMDSRNYLWPKKSPTELAMVVNDLKDVFMYMYVVYAVECRNGTYIHVPDSHHLKPSESQWYSQTQ